MLAAAGGRYFRGVMVFYPIDAALPAGLPFGGFIDVRFQNTRIFLPMNPDLFLPRKWTFRAHGRRVVFKKKPLESNTHVLIKALLWALFLPQYPNLAVEVGVGNRYKPDLMEMDESGVPVFWGEAGQVGQRKMKTLVNRFRSTHLVFAKWDVNLSPFERILKKETGAIRRSAPVDLISFPEDSGERFFRPDGEIRIALTDVVHVRC